MVIIIAYVHMIGQYAKYGGGSVSYMIEYEPHKKSLYPCRKRIKRNNSVKIIFCMTLLLIGVFVCRSESVREWLIPGDAQVTSEAFTTMITELREGETMGDAVAAFCVQVINGA